MMTMYKNDAGVIEYWQCWFNDDESIVIYYWGVLGKKGEYTEQPASSTRTTLDENIQIEISKKIEEGYELKADIDLYKINITFLKPLITKSKSDEIIFWLNELLGWSGIGKFNELLDDNEFINFQCLVFDKPMAQRLIEKEVKNTSFNDYTNIK